MSMRKCREERIGNDLSEFQKWVDYDMKKYGKISGVTRDKIRKAGLSIVKDQYGDYEVIADRPIKEEVEGVKHIKDLDINDIMELRNEIVLGSLFYRDYRNSFGIDEHEVCDFFDGFLDYACDEYKDRHGKEAWDIGVIYDEFDNEGEIVDYFDMYKHGYFEGLKEDTVKQGNHWVNKGKEGTHGKFRTKKEADAQRKAMFARGFKESKKINESEEIDRKLFVSLVRLGDKPYDGYSILNDGNFVKRIYAENDIDAKRQFRDWLDKRKR